jgi:hypothetical protein
VAAHRQDLLVGDLARVDLVRRSALRLNLDRRENAPIVMS